MSSNKLTKRPRACDFCRKRKTKCQPSESDTARCSSCVEFGVNNCTFIAPTGRIEPTFSYAEKLEKRLKSLERLIKRLPGSSKNPTVRVAPDPAMVLEMPSAITYRPHAAPLPVENDIFFKSSAGRYFGRSSWMPLLGLAYELREEAGGKPSLPAEPIYEEDSDHWALGAQSGGYMTPLLHALPDEMTLTSLLRIYFRCVSPFWPIIHQSTVKTQCADLSYLTQSSQAKLILMICAVASVYKPDTSNTRGKPPGWSYFTAVHDARQGLIPKAAATLVDVQVIALQAFYYLNTGAPHSAWLVLGTGIRSAQDVGAHQSSFAHGRHPLEAEMWKRVFWFFVAMDRSICSFMGQAEMIRDENFDLALPEGALLEDGASDSEYFRCTLQLGWFSSFASRSAYAKKPWFETLNMTSKDDVLTAVEALIARWDAELPDHLRWDPARQNPIHFEQSAELQVSLATLEIFVHRPWAPAVPMSVISPMSDKDVAGKAAQFCCEVVDILYNRNPSFISLTLVHGFSLCAVVLQTRLWAIGKRTDVPAATAAKLKAVYEQSLENMKIMSRQWPPAARMFQIVDRVVHGNSHIKMPAKPTSECPRTKKILAAKFRDDNVTLPSSSGTGMKQHNGISTWEQANAVTSSVLDVVQLDNRFIPSNLLSWDDVFREVHMGYGEETTHQNSQLGDGQDTVWANQLKFPAEWDGAMLSPR